MAPQTLQVLLVDGNAALRAALRSPGLVVSEADPLGAASGHDAVVVSAGSAAALRALLAHAELPQAAFDSALLVCAAIADDGVEEALMLLGVETVCGVGDLPTLPRMLRQAVWRKRVQRAARTAYATDLATGLPHEAQLLEHMAQLLALREREPAPMVLLVLRVTGYAAAAARLGGEAANVLRRKVAVRLRSGLRASDVVAAIGPDAFAVLLGRLQARGDGEQVAAKLVRALQAPLLVAGQPCTVSLAVGLAQYPDHGKDARGLLQHASAQAGTVAAMGREGLGGATERSPGAAANDDAG